MASTEKICAVPEALISAAVFWGSGPCGLCCGRVYWQMQKQGGKSMPKEQEQFQGSVLAVLEAVMFENWLRFYFISEKPDAEPGPDGEPPLFMAVPVKGMERIGSLYAHLLPLAEEMNGKPVDFEVSRRAVCNFVLEHVDGKVMPRDTAAMIFESATFQIQMQLFNTWVQMHENQLDAAFMEFGAWRALFAQWRDEPGARELAEKLSLALQGGQAEQPTRTVQ